jgi:predicted Holliday junction resolvase-like endonuclease
MIYVIFIAIIFVMFWIIYYQIWIRKKENVERELLQKKYNETIGENRRLQTALIRIETIEKERMKKNEEINNAPNSGIAGILNSVLRNKTAGNKN